MGRIQEAEHLNPRTPNPSYTIKPGAGAVRDEANCFQVALSRLRGVRKIAFLEFDRHDEATTVLNTTSSIGAEVDGYVVQNELPGNSDDTVTEAAPTKVMRCQRIIGALLAQPDGTGQEKYFIIASSVPAQPFALQRGTAENIAQAFLVTDPVRWQGVQDFEFKTRHVCSDRLASQILADETITQMRPHWQHLFTPCEIHMLAGSMSKALLLLQDGITGMIRLVLSLQSGGWMRVFRRCLYAIIFESLEILEGESSREDAMYRHLACGLFLGHWKQRKRTSIAPQYYRKDHTLFRPHQ